ncbi:MAG TPA: DnaB-like helicase C-terminal domain-containing protein, partial [Candidatus Fermentibacter sp.]|nr:DnaB-like helicase C-terminal domain-containing protein [Candidatus Fermentibacter sp.]
LPMFVNERAGITSLELRASARRLRKRFGLSAVFVDYLQLMRGIGGEENRQQEIARISGDLKALAKDLDVPVIALSQLSRRAVSHEGPARLPRLSDLRESGAIEQDADLVIFLHEEGGEEAYADRSYPRDRSVKLVIGKQRNGPRGEIDMIFQTELGRFLEMARD